MRGGDPKGEIVCSCAIITTSANELLSPIHDRMPVILPRKLESFWLDHDIQDPALAGILTPYTTTRWRHTRSLSWSTAPPTMGRNWSFQCGRPTQIARVLL